LFSTAAIHLVDRLAVGGDLIRSLTPDVSTNTNVTFNDFASRLDAAIEPADVPDVKPPPGEAVSITGAAAAITRADLQTYRPNDASSAEGT
jgi:hypothetical protein